jgi:hypothetical protein
LLRKIDAGVTGPPDGAPVQLPVSKVVPKVTLAAAMLQCRTRGEESSSMISGNLARRFISGSPVTSRPFTCNTSKAWKTI